LHATPTPIGVADSNFLLTLGLYPVYASIPTKTNHKVPTSVWPVIMERHKTQSLRQLGKEYNVSHESVRRAILFMGIDKG